MSGVAWPLSASAGKVDEPPFERGAWPMADACGVGRPVVVGLVNGVALPLTGADRGAADLAERFVAFGVGCGPTG
eukprot:9430211-Lingulodinium_polyedra.AAC.1